MTEHFIEKYKNMFPGSESLLGSGHVFVGRKLCMSSGLGPGSLRGTVGQEEECVWGRWVCPGRICRKFVAGVSKIL